MKKLAVFLVLLAGTLWGAIGIFVRRFSELGLSSMQTVALRLVISALIFSVFVLIYDRKLFRFHFKDIWVFIGSGIVSLGAFSFFYFQSINLSSLSAASVLLYTAPSFVAVFSLFVFKEKLTIIKVVSILLAFLGCALTVGVIGGSFTVTLSGFLYGLGSGVCYALYSIFSRIAIEKEYSPITVTVYTFIFASVAVMCLIDPSPVIKVVTSDVSGFLYCVVFALLSCVIPYISYTFALKFIKPSTASVIATVEPVVATLTGALFFGEAVAFPFGYIGIALVLVSVALVNIKKKVIIE